MKSTEVREKFLQFFEKNGHRRVNSSSLVPAEDPTLLFTNSGMVQFKDVFLGLRDLGFRTATTCQKCVRAGGKHNDLENVGFTPRHHTFFEMLGNFSFGKYFKKEAIAYAWELYTKDFGIPKDKLRVTVYEKDDEAFDLWKAQGISNSHLGRLGEVDNFWAMGETGPCGPCTEIHYDWGKEYGCERPDCAPGCSCGGARFLEIANLVFMQFNRDTTGKMSALPKPSVDTGSGLERVAAVLQGKFSNYDTDVFSPILTSIGKRVGKTYGQEESTDIAMRVVADHLRASAFLINDGVTPSNEGRGYVLRRIVRRAIRYGKKLGQENPFLFDLVPNFVNQMGNVYSELKTNEKNIILLLREEETRFHETLHRGMGLLEEAISKCTHSKQTKIAGDVAFRLYDTFGFPLDLIEVIARENKLEVDITAFDKLMEKQRQTSGTSKKGSSEIPTELLSKRFEDRPESTQFMGYQTLSLSSKITRLLDDSGNEVPALSNSGFVVFESTPFYPEGGGQVGDKGEIKNSNLSAKVTGTLKIGKAILHSVNITKGKLENGHPYDLVVDSHLRQLTARNHTATHLLHAALRKVLGDRVKQAGSLVEPSRLRFDFTFPRAVSSDELKEIESLVNEQIKKQAKVKIKEMPFDEAMKTGALAFFDEKYGDRVRVVQVGDDSFSTELCGGTHLTNTVFDIGLFKISHESSVASGVRRIEAITSESAFQFLNARDDLLSKLEVQLASSDPIHKITQLLSELKQLQKENERLKFQAASQTSQDKKLWEKKKVIQGFQLVAETIPATSPKILRELVDQVRDKLKEKTLVLLGSEIEGKVSLCLGISKDLVGAMDAGKLIQGLAQYVNGTGGGRADFAQAGGNNSQGLEKAFQEMERVLTQWTP